MPSIWRGHSWSAHGDADANLVKCLMDRIRAGASLPSADLLAHNPSLEASAAQALDALAPRRVPCMFHADDPVFMASSKYGLQEIMHEVELWASECGAAFHTTPDKTVYMCAGADASQGRPIVFNGVQLSAVSVQRWLGILWPDDLDFTGVLRSRLQLCDESVAQLAGLAQMNVISWPMLCELFESQVDSLMDIGRWLFIMVAGAETLICDSYNRWARILLGAEWYRNAGTCSSEMGWSISGYHRVVLTVAVFRAKLCLTSCDDWHRSFHTLAAQLQCGWSAQSLSVLRAHGVMDWPTWAGAGSTLEEYRAYVVGVLREAFILHWRPCVEKHSMHPPYSAFEESPGVVLSFCKALQLDAVSEMSLRHWCRLRCGLPLLSHIGGRESGARYQNYIFCEQSTRKPVIHGVAICPHWTMQRQAFSAAVGMSPGDSHINFTQRWLSRIGDKATLAIVLKWAALIDQSAYNFWKSH